jgi:AAA15 family ATPase/GTPase
VSGGLICVDFDTKNGDKFQDWQMLILEQYQELLSKLVVEKTPSGGYHIIFRSDKSIRNIKLAMNKENKATIETRGEGGYFVCAPSKNYSFYYKDFNDINKLTNEETEIILSVASSLNENIQEKIEHKDIKNNSGITPFDDYDAKNTPIDLLIKNEWRIVFERAGVIYLQRPGKSGRGISASWNNVPDRFYVFSTSTQFENEHVYKASAVYTILEHGGNFSSAARELKRLGYGENKKTCEIINTNTVKNALVEVRKTGYLRGKSTGWKILDKYYSVIKGQFTVITGYPSSGKSEVIDALMMNMAMLDNWKFAVFAPENYPVVMHYHKLVEKYIGLPMTGPDKMSDENLEKAVSFIDKHFYFIDAGEEEITLDSILEKTKELIRDKKIDGLCIDPWNEIELDKPASLSTTEFIGKCLRISRKFARANNIHLWIVAHPIKPVKDKDGNYPVPDLYSIEGSAHWRNKSDNGICVYRDFATDEIFINIQKIKYRYCGKLGSVIFKYNNSCGRYYEIGEKEEF